ncbi:gas vesicle protein [Bacillus ectoiniformans]|uniref:YtxH domain-containing protein n=1 Tax=Bacillus ectoiniformans TaxID=1494429 RepID=UPI0019578221|nr:YtxH domain-containing protein [Bacillus ectoiniformans]MBM7649480.1 gas vesicle protein [Bacillus ectoiniformans]
MVQTTISQSKTGSNSKLLTGMMIGAVVGGAVALLDTNTRNKVTSSTRGVKDSTVNMVTKVKENPGEVKNDFQERFKNASAVLKEAISEAQDLYEKVNKDVIEPVSQVTEDSNNILSTAQEATEDLKGIGSKVKEAGAEVTADDTAGNSQTGQTGRMYN